MKQIESIFKKSAAAFEIEDQEELSDYLGIPQDSLHHSLE